MSGIQYILIVSKRYSETLYPAPLLDANNTSLAEVRYVCINNDHHSALILHIASIATNNYQCFEKLVRETISPWMKDLSGHTEQSLTAQERQR